MQTTPERWLVAAWPGLGQVATTAAVYLLSKLRMHQVAEFPARDLFELDSVDVTAGVLHAARLPRSRLFLWRNPAAGRDIVVFLGEAQPPVGRLALCQRLLAAARSLGVRRVLTFAALASDMEPSASSRVYGVASDAAGLDELKRQEVAVLAAGRISGLNGVLLAAAAEAGIPATGLLGEMPGIAPQLPCPNASVAVLRSFAGLAGFDLDLSELVEYGRTMQTDLSALYDRVRKAFEPGAPPAGEPSPAAAPAPEPERGKPPQTMLADEDAERVEKLFQEARGDRAKAFELKKELDRLGAFARYEDRFLDLFEQGPP